MVPVPAGDLIVFSTRDSAFQGPEEGETETSLTSDEVRSSLDAIDFTLRPPTPKAPPAAPAAPDEAATAESEAPEAASPQATVSRAAWGDTNATPPAGEEAEAATPTGPSAPASAGEGAGPDATAGDASPDTTAPQSGSEAPPSAAAPPSADGAASKASARPVVKDSPHLAVSPPPPPAASETPDGASTSAPVAEETPTGDSTASGPAPVVPITPEQTAPGPAPGAAARGSGPVVCELVDVELEPDPLVTDGDAAPEFQPMSLTIRGAERLAVVVEDGHLRRQIYSCLGGLNLPTRGGVHLFGHDGAALGAEERRALRRGQIGLLHPDLPLLTALTVEENLRLALELAAEPHPRERLAELLDRFDLHHSRHRYPGECPVDVRIRSGLARALASRPLCLVADLVEDTDEEERTLALVALGVGLEGARTTAIIILPLGEIPDWVDRAVQVSAGGMTELTRLDPVPASSDDDASSGADAESGDTDITPEEADGEADAAAADELEEAA